MGAALEELADFESKGADLIVELEVVAHPSISHRYGASCVYSSTLTCDYMVSSVTAFGFAERCGDRASRWFIWILEKVVSRSA